MNKENESGEDMLSALMDGQLRGQEFASTLEQLGDDENARLTWYVYHLVGDVLRSEESIIRAHDADFLQRLRVRLEQDVPLALRSDAVDPMPGVGIANRAANDSSRWKFVAGLASLMVVVIIGWQFLGGLTDARDVQQVMIRDPQIDALLAAHRQSGGASLLQMSAGFLRNATFEGTNR